LAVSTTLKKSSLCTLKKSTLLKKSTPWGAILHPFVRLLKLLCCLFRFKDDRQRWAGLFVFADAEAGSIIRALCDEDGCRALDLTATKLGQRVWSAVFNPLECLLCQLCSFFWIKDLYRGWALISKLANADGDTCFQCFWHEDWRRADNITVLAVSTTLKKSSLCTLKKSTLLKKSTPWGAILHPFVRLLKLLCCLFRFKDDRQRWAGLFVLADAETGSIIRALCDEDGCRAFDLTATKLGQRVRSTIFDPLECLLCQLCSFLWIKDLYRGWALVSKLANADGDTRL